jgi:hypothetical protein
LVWNFALDFTDAQSSLYSFSTSLEKPKRLTGRAFYTWGYGNSSNAGRQCAACLAKSEEGSSDHIHCAHRIACSGMNKSLLLDKSFERAKVP